MEISQAGANQWRAQPAVSLFQQCMAMVEKLYRFEYFENFLFPGGVEHLGRQSDGSFSLINPVQLLCDCFRLGAPLAHLYNQLQPGNPLEVPDVSWFTHGPDAVYKSTMKKPVMQFLVNCKSELKLSEEEASVIVSDLYSEDTTSFVKVLKIVEKLLDEIEARGFLPPPRPLPINFPNQQDNVPTNNLSKLLAELLDTERGYLQDLEKLHSYQKALTDQNVLPKDKCYQIFFNLSSIVEFQHRFLIQMETTLSLPPNQHRLGYLFINMEEQFSAVYESYCGNYDSAVKVASEEKNSLMRLSSIIDPVIQLPSYLIKPIQRICKYPLFFSDLIKMSSNSYPYMEELNQGLEAAKRIADTVNEQKRRDENKIHKVELIERMEDWKGLNPEDFGDLLLLDKFPMSSGEVEREYHIFLFSRLLLCCKDQGKRTKSNRQSRKERKDTSTELSTYSLRGNISIHLILEVKDTSSSDRSYCGICVTWRDQTETESFTLKCRNHEQVRLWKNRLERLMEEDRKRRKSAAESQFDIMKKNYSWGVDEQSEYSRSDSYYSRNDSNQEMEPKMKLQRSGSIPIVYYPPAHSTNHPPMPKNASNLVRVNTYSSINSSSNVSINSDSRGRLQDRRPGNAPRGSSAGSALVRENSESYSPYFQSQNRSSSNSPPPQESYNAEYYPNANYSAQYGLPSAPPSGPLPQPPLHPRPQMNGYGYEPYASETYGYPPSPTASGVPSYGRSRNMQNSNYSPSMYPNGQVYHSPSMQPHPGNNTGYMSGNRTDLSRSKSYSSRDGKDENRGQRSVMMRSQNMPQIVDIKSSPILSNQFNAPPPNLPLPPTPQFGIRQQQSPVLNDAAMEYLNYQRRKSASSLHSTNSDRFGERNSSPPPPVPAIPSNYPTQTQSNYTFPSNNMSNLMQQLTIGGQTTPAMSAIERLEGLESSLIDFVEDPDSTDTDLGLEEDDEAKRESTGNRSSGAISSGETMLTHSNSISKAGRASSTSSRSTHSQSFIKVRTHYGRETLVIAVQYGCTYNELHRRIDEKIRMYGGTSFLMEEKTGTPRVFKMKYQDDEGDYVRIDNDTDVALAFEMARKSAMEKGVLNLFVV